MATFKWDGILYELISVYWIFSHLKIQYVDKFALQIFSHRRKSKGCLSHSFSPRFLHFLPSHVNSKKKQKKTELDELHSSSEQFKFISKMPLIW